jgi:uncharacterized protein
MRLDKPDEIVSREREWRLLAEFLATDRAGSRLAVVYGRRRQGKTMLLQELATQLSCLYWEAAQQSRSQNLESFSAAWTTHSNAPGPIRFGSWEEALATVLSPSHGRATVLLDEVGYLVETAPEFPSLLQRHFGPKQERDGVATVVLCGSIYAQMTKLLASGQPLRGRHSLVLDIGPFDVRTSAEFWGLASNPDAAFRLHALIGGTPAYLRFAGGNRPHHGNVDNWVVRYLLDASSPLFYEGQVLVAEDPTLADKSLYWSVLGAIADGYRRRSDLAAALGRSSGALAQPLDVLTAASWIEMRSDPFHPRYSSARITEPMLRMHRVVIAPERRRLSMGLASDVWTDAQARVARLIYGPHLEWMANDWIVRANDASIAGEAITSSGPGVLRSKGVAHQIDIVAQAPDRNDVQRIRAIGEVKADGQPMGADQLARLDEIVPKLGERGAPIVRRILVARRGFTSELRRVAKRRSDVELVDLHRVYGGEESI